MNYKDRTALDLCRLLVEIQSTSGQEREAAEAIADQMNILGYDEVYADEYGSIIGIRHGCEPGCTLLFDAHLDTVPVLSQDRWQYDPFGAKIENGRIWGLGAADTKGSLAAMVCAAAQVPREIFVGRIVVTATVCEENMTGAALEHVLNDIPADLVIIGEPTDLKVGVAQKGRLGITVEAIGKSAHTSRPELGKNAVYKMLEAIDRLRAVPLRSDSDIGPGILELVEIISEPFPGTSAVPFGCRARFVQRIMPGESPAQILEHFRATIHGLEGLTIEIEQFGQSCYTGKMLFRQDFVPGWRTSLDGPWLERIRTALNSVGIGIETFVSPSGTNGAASAGHLGIPTFIFGPGSIEQAHAVDEWISIESLLIAERSYVAIAKSCLAPSEG